MCLSRRRYCEIYRTLHTMLFRTAYCGKDHRCDAVVQQIGITMIRIVVVYYVLFDLRFLDDLLYIVHTCVNMYTLAGFMLVTTHR